MASSTNFFTEGHPLHTLSAAWRERKIQLRAAQLQDANDYLYEVVSRDILSRRAEIHEALLETVWEAKRPSDLSIPLWTYYAAWYDEVPDARDPSYEEAQRLMWTKGYSWFVGLTGLGVDPETITTANRWQCLWGATSCTTVNEVVQHTDFKQRLALMFGRNFWVSMRPTAQRDIREPLGATVTKCELRLHYFPTGNLRPESQTALDAVAAKYAHYRPRTVPVYEKPTVWKGVPSKVERVVLTTLSYESPVPSSPSSMPPLLPTRSNGRVLNPEDMREVARTLFEAEGAVGSYPPPACYCGYHHDGDESE